MTAIHKGDVIEYASCHARVLDVCVSSQHKVAKVMPVKNLFRGQTPEWIELNGPMPVKKSTEREMEKEYCRLLQRVHEGWEDLTR